LPAALNQRVARLKIKDSALDNDFLFWLLNNDYFEKLAIAALSGMAQLNLGFKWLNSFQIPMPPLETQRQLVDEIAAHQRIIDGARKVVESLKPNLELELAESLPEGVDEWEEKPLGEICKLFTDGDWVESKDQSTDGIRLIQTGNVGFGEYLDKADKSRFISEAKFAELNCKEVFLGDVLVSRLPDPVGRSCVVPSLQTRMITAVDCTIIRFDEEIALPKFFVYYTMTGKYYRDLNQYLTGASRQRISRSNLEKVKIPLPPLEIQRAIVARIERERAIVEGNRELIRLYEAKVKKVIERVWES
jgi:type I restriction enzyme S subunit